MPSLGVPIQVSIEAGKNLDLFTAKDYDGLDRLEDSYTKTLLSTIGLSKQNKNNNRVNNNKPKTFHLIRNQMKPADHSRRQRYNSKSVLQKVFVSPVSPSTQKITGLTKKFKKQQTTKSATAEMIAKPNVNNKAMTKLPVKKTTPSTKIKKAEKKTINIDNKHLVKVIQLLNLLKEYSGLQITHEGLLKDNHHKGTRKQSTLPMVAIQNDKLYSSDFVPETETRNSELEALSRGELNKQALERLTAGTFLKPDLIDNSHKHHYVTIDTSTGQIIKEEFGVGNFDTLNLLGLVGKLAHEVKSGLKKTPPTHSPGALRALNINKHHLTPENTVSAPAFHRTGGKKTVVQSLREPTLYSGNILTKDHTSELRKRMLNDINANLKFVSTTELKSMQDKLKMLKNFRKEKIVKS